MSIAARNAAASDTQSVTTSADRNHEHKGGCKTPVDGRALHEVKKFYSSNLCVSVDRTNGICTCNFLVRFMFPRRPTERHIHTFSTAERPVCVPYKRKRHRLNRRVAAPAASATVNKQKITKRAFDGRTMHGLNFTLCFCSVNCMFPVARPNGIFTRFPPRNYRR